VVTKHAQWAELGEAIKADGVKQVFVAALKKITRNQRTAALPR
jgi:hypothetical protein